MEAKEIKGSRLVFKIGAWSGVALIALIPLQIFFFVKYPPPSGAAGIFDVFSDNLFIALINLDLFYFLTNIIMLPVYAGLYYILKRTNAPLAALTMVLMFTGVAAFLSSNPAFAMMELSEKYFAVAGPAEKQPYIAAGEAILAGLTGSAYVGYYYLNAVGLFLLSLIMMKSSEFGRAAVISGMLSAFFMLIPSSFGTAGMIFSFVSIIPYTVWLVIVIKRLFMEAGKVEDINC